MNVSYGLCELDFMFAKAELCYNLPTLSLFLFISQSSFFKQQMHYYYCYYHYQRSARDAKHGINRNIIYLQNGGGCDQNPVSVQTILASPTSKWPSLQVNVTKAPTAYFRWLADTLVPSIRPFIGTSGWAHWIAN